MFLCHKNSEGKKKKKKMEILVSESIGQNGQLALKSQLFS